MTWLGTGTTTVLGGMFGYARGLGVRNTIVITSDVNRYFLIILKSQIIW